MQVSELMTTDVRTVPPDMRLVDLERFLISARVTGAPVVQDKRLVGVVSRSDIVRQLVVEQTRAEYVSDAQRSGLGTWYHLPDFEMAEWVRDEVAEHLEHLRVHDIMIADVITIAPNADIREAARLMVVKRIHRVLVVESDEVRGILSTTDLVRVLALGSGEV